MQISKWDKHTWSSHLASINFITILLKAFLGELIAVALAAALYVARRRDAGLPPGDLNSP
jgi:hypothetical protein